MCTFMPLHESMGGSCLDELPRSPSVTDLRPYIDQVYISLAIAVLSGLCKSFLLTVSALHSQLLPSSDMD